MCYILDEPTIGLHPRDNRMLLDTLGKLEGKGNTVVVVEHDEDTIRRAEHVIDLGPGAGVNGGEVVAAGTVQTLDGSTALAHRPFSAPIRCATRCSRRAPVNVKGRRRRCVRRIQGARLHNLKNLSVRIPLGSA